MRRRRSTAGWPRSALRLREPRRLPRSLSRQETTDLLNSLSTWRDRFIAGLILFFGMRSCEVLALQIKDVDVGGRWLLVSGKGSKERRVPLDRDVGAGAFTRRPYSWVLQEDDGVRSL